jgi:hypothetical protein
MVPPMRRLSLALALLVGVCGPARVQATPAAPVGQGLLCRSAVAVAERSSGLPTQLLAAISRVESGRRDPTTGAVHPWPWSVNADGRGLYYDTKAEAVAAVRAMQANGVRSIDVGCGQINLMHHPDAFPSLEVAFDPQANAAYAAKFLKELFARTGDWDKAAGMYHSATPGLGDDYREKVLAAWPEEQRAAGLMEATPLAQAWSATLAARPLGVMRVAHMQQSGTVRGPRTIVPPGRGIDAHRAAPVGLAYQATSHRAGG